MEVTPFTSVGPLKFGDSRRVSREKLGSSFSTFQKTVGANETDSFDDLGLHLYYSDAGSLEFVEAFDPANVTFRKIRFLGRSLEVVLADMETLGFSPTADDVGVKFDLAGVGLFAPSGVVEGVAVHRKGYYDS